MHNETAIYTAYDDFKGPDTAEAEKNLMRAILKSAMDDISKNGEAAREALNYFMTEGDYYLYSFESVCRHLALCPKTVRMVVGLIETEFQPQANSQLMA